MRGNVRDVNTNNIIKDCSAEITGHIIQGILKVQKETHRIEYAAGPGVTARGRIGRTVLPEILG